MVMSERRIHLGKADNPYDPQEYNLEDLFLNADYIPRQSDTRDVA